MRLVRISLAVKYRILFGVAVAAIIGAALYVPWYLIEALVYEQPFREAQRVAADFFRLELAPVAPGGAPLGGIHSGSVSLAPSPTARGPSFVRLTPDVDDPANLLNQNDPKLFAAQALGTFLRHPKREYVYARTSMDGAGHAFRYAQAVRVTRSCLECHDEGKSARPYRENELAGAIVVDLPLDDSDKELLFNRMAILAAGGLAGILAILVFYVITRKFILAPIHELREVAIRVTEGDLDVRSTVETGDEFQQLSENLNTMLERLKAAQEELRTANRALDQKLGEMAETNVALFEANRVKGEFLANVTHELRTPLTSIIGFAELLREGPLAEQNGKNARYAENILISGRILLEIINDLLDLAKIEAGKVDLRLEAVRIGDVCSTLLDFTRPLAERKGLDLRLEADDDLPILITDKGRLRQVLFNLLSNAVKFTPEGGWVVVRAARDGPDSVRLEVQDSGPGISAESQTLIFEKFRQIDGSATREHHGTGLGLAIARELTTLLGGTIGVQSEAGRGSTFWVRLPTATPEPSPRTSISLV